MKKVYVGYLRWTHEICVCQLAATVMNYNKTRAEEGEEPIATDLDILEMRADLEVVMEFDHDNFRATIVERNLYE